jgi:hypothetical protein
MALQYRSDPDSGLKKKISNDIIGDEVPRQIAYSSFYKKPQG